MKIAIFGTSGFAREVADICLAADYSEILLIEKEGGDRVRGPFPVVPEADVDSLYSDGYVFAVGVGQNKIRKAIYNKFSYLKFPDLIHPSATFGWGQLQEILKHSGNIIAAGVRFTNNITMGDFGIYNLNSTVGHDCVIGDYVNIAPGANISGNVYLAEGCYIGTGAQILQGKSIDNKLAVGAYAVVGAGAVVVKEVPVSVTVKGVPAQI